MASAESFYNGLAADYDCLFEDWWSASLWHGSVIARLLSAEGIEPPARLLDFTCGIGTQALPLAGEGFAVLGTDISAAAVHRARAEADGRGLSVPVAACDAREVRSFVSGTFDAAISFDNALPHLLTDEALVAALLSVRECLTSGGVFLASIRDYDALTMERPSGVPISLYGEHGARHASGQHWRWHESGQRLDITLFTMAETTEGWSASTHETTYRALLRSELAEALTGCGYADVRWLMPEESGYFQPIVLATARG